MVTPKSTKAKAVVVSLWRAHGMLLKGGTADTAIRLAEEVSGHKLSDEDKDGIKSAAGVAFVDAEPWIMWAKDENNVGEIAHELFHVTSHIMRTRGLTLSRDSEEAYAYTLTYLTNMFFDKTGWKDGRKIHFRASR